MREDMFWGPRHEKGTADQPHVIRGRFVGKNMSRLRDEIDDIRDGHVLIQFNSGHDGFEAWDTYVMD